MTEELKPCPLCSKVPSIYPESAIYPDSERGNMEFGAMSILNYTKSERFILNCSDCVSMQDNSEEGLIHKWNRRASPWVRVEDGLPKHGDVIFVKLEYPLIKSAEETRYAREKFDKNIGFDKVVTHWMPIPPLGEENE